MQIKDIISAITTIEEQLKFNLQPSQNKWIRKVPHAIKRNIWRKLPTVDKQNQKYKFLLTLMQQNARAFSEEDLITKDC